ATAGELVMSSVGADNKKGASPCRRAPFISSKQLTSISSCRTVRLAVFMLWSGFCILFKINWLCEIVTVYCSSAFCCLCYYASNSV
ncbi:hypothetical protein QMV98_27345, partial [Klebsiella pneumoniae]|uniref:hypothetical protein n=7 Tax=Klebsiella pneumoniae TaxID=573 RepID=UPI0024BCB757